MKKYDHMLEEINNELKMMKDAILYLKTTLDVIIVDLKAHNMGEMFTKKEGK